MKPPAKDNVLTPACSVQESAAGDQSSGCPVKTTAGGVSWKVLNAELLDQIKPVLQDPGKFAGSNPDRLYQKPGVILARIPTTISGPQKWVLRRTTYARALARLRDCLRVSGPMRSFNNSLAYRRAGIPTPKVIAAGISRRFWLPRAGYLLMEEISPGLTLVACLKSAGRLPRQAVLKVALLIARLHDQGFLHGDLTINNILLDEQLDPWLVDLDRVVFKGSPLQMDDVAEDFYRLARHVDSLGCGARIAAFRLVKHYCEFRDWRGRERELIRATVARLRSKVPQVSGNPLQRIANPDEY